MEVANLHQRPQFGVASSSRFTGKIHNRAAMMLFGGFEVLNLFSYLRPNSLGLFIRAPSDVHLAEVNEPRDCPPQVLHVCFRNIYHLHSDKDFL